MFAPLRRGGGASLAQQHDGAFRLGPAALAFAADGKFCRGGDELAGMEGEAGRAGVGIYGEDAAADRVGIFRVDDPELVVLVGGERGQVLDREHALLRGRIPYGDGAGLRRIAEERDELGNFQVGEIAVGFDLFLQVGELTAGQDVLGLKLVLYALHFHLRERGLLVLCDGL